MKVSHSPNWPQKGQKGLFWLGQAGFWIETGRHSILIDPYLSDSLAKKYAGQVNDHQRMVAAPYAPEEIPEPDLILVTHAHTDHMDAETLAPIATKYPEIPIVIPRAKIEVAKERIGQDAKFVPMDADEIFEFDEQLSILAFPAAHEYLEKDENGDHLFLGYGIIDDGFRVYHSGDSIPFDGLSASVSEFAPHIALLPVNGRDERRLKAGIPGNFTLEEAYELARDADVFVPHHWGMFAFNTIARDEIIDFAHKKSATNLVIPVHGGSLIFDDFN